MEHGAAFRGAGCGDLPAQLLCHLLCDGKAEAEAAGFVFPAFVAAVKAVENMGEVFRRDSAAEVLNRELHPSLILRERQLYPPACRLLFQGVFQQAADDALQVVRIAAQATYLGERRFQRDAFLIGDGLHLQRRFHGDGGKVDELRGKRRVRALHIGERERMYWRCSTSLSRIFWTRYAPRLPSCGRRRKQRRENIERGGGIQEAASICGKATICSGELQMPLAFLCMI